MSSSREPSPLPTLDAAIGIFDIYQFIRPALPALRDCLQDEINADSAYAALQSQVYFMSRFLCFADIVGSEYLIPDDIHAFRRLHADLAKLLSPDQLTALLCEDWIIDNPARKSLPLDYTFPPAPAGALLFTPQRQKLAEDFMRKQQQEHTRRVAAQKAREERARLAALREQAEREEAAQQAELQRQAAMSAHQTEVDQAPVGCLTIDLDSLIRFSEGDINAREATPPLPASSKAAGKRKRASSVRRSERQLAKSKAIVTGSGDEEDGPAGSAGPSKRAKYAPSRARTKILSQEDLLAKAQALWQQTPAGLRADAPPPFIDAAQLKLLRLGFNPKISAPCFACVMGDTEKHCQFLGANKWCAPCTHHKRGRCSFVWNPEERASFRDHAYSLGQDSLASFQEDLRAIQFHTSQGLISARQAEASYDQAKHLAAKFSRRVLDLYNEDFPAALTRSLFTSQQCVDLILKHASNVDVGILESHGLPPIDELLLFLDPNVFRDIPTTGWEHTVLQYRMYCESQEETSSDEEHAATEGLLDLEAEEASSDESSDESSGESGDRLSPRRPSGVASLYQGFADGGDSGSSESESEA
ncbi:hypothetical protein BDZ97DRAFT_1760695 [Flammula alnicola]|nr:hypothetical protein BDZ97DRAFT_1760695 [Flammula alnicola]